MCVKYSLGVLKENWDGKEGSQWVAWDDITALVLDGDEVVRARKLEMLMGGDFKRKQEEAKRKAAAERAAAAKAARLAEKARDCKLLGVRMPGGARVARNI